MDRYTSALEDAVLRFMDATDLMNFAAATWGIQESPAVRLRLLQLQEDDSFVVDQLDTILANLGEPSTTGDIGGMVNDDSRNREQEDIDETIQICLNDGDWNTLTQHSSRLEQEDIDETIQICLNDGDWNPLTPPTSTLHQEDMDETANDDDCDPFTPTHIGSGEQPRPSQLQYSIKNKSERTYAKKCRR